MSKAFTDISSEELDGLIARVTAAKEHNLALSAEDCQLLLDALLSLVTFQEELADHDITIGKLRKLAGIVKSSERISSQVGKSKRSPKRKKPTPPQVKTEVIKHELEDQAKGDTCPECQTGKLYKYEPATFLRITGHSPFTPEQHVMERLRCNTCGAYFTAQMPEEVLADGDVNQKYGYSARSIMAVAKFYSGTPYYRQGSLQDMLGVSIAASTIFDQTELVANAIYPVFRYLLNILAADAVHYYLDDTTNKINNQEAIIKKARRSDKERVRTGIYTSGVIATTPDSHKLVLYETNVGHAGEFIDDILKNRSPGLSPPILMSDALSNNQPTVLKPVVSLCNAHGRRQFFDVLNHFQEEVEHVIGLYNQIWANEQITVEGAMSQAERLAYHKAHSLPVMQSIKEWGAAKLESKEVEQNSGLGKAIKYFINHYDGLTCFCEVEGAMLDNNLMEAQLKLIVRNRKNAGPFRTGSGAAIGDVITSMIATAAQAGTNPVNYFTHLQRNADKVKASPQQYLPWDFNENG